MPKQSIDFLKTKPKRSIFLLLFLLFLIAEYLLFKLNLLNLSHRYFYLFLLFQINLILILFLIYQIFRYIFYTFLEIKIQRFSKSLRVKLLLIYLFSMVFASTLLIIVGFFFLKKTLDLWFKEYSAVQLYLTAFGKEDIFRSLESQLIAKANLIENEYITKTDIIRSKELRERYRYLLNLDAIEVYTLDGDLYKKTYSNDEFKKYGIPPSILEELLKDKTPKRQIINLGGKYYVRVFTYVKTKDGHPYILVVGKVLDSSEIFKTDDLPWDKILRLSIFLLFILIFLLVLFIGVWVGNKLGKRLSEPLRLLSEATEKISHQDYNINLPDVFYQDDEIGLLIRRFNEMVKRLKDFEEERKKYIDSLKAILDQLPIGILLLTKDFQPIFQNRFILDFLNDIGLKDCNELCNQIKLFDVLSSIDITNGFYKIYEFTTDKGVFNLGISVFSFEFTGQLHYLIIVENLTEKEVLKRLSIWKEVAVRIAHEIKNPLTPIKLSIERLRKKLSDSLSEEDKNLLNQTVDVVLKSIEELQKLSHDLYVLTKKPILDKVEGSLIENIKEVINLYKLAYPNITIKLSIDKDVVFPFDPLVMKRLWINLFENSIKSMKEEGSITIDVLANSDEVMIVFTDTGEGLPDEVISTFNSGQWESLKKFGTGLIVIQTVVHLHNGRIVCERGHPRGSRFIIEFPITKK
jgi:two-component system nitrogen regulation sensor histidine kinase NtrY